MVSIGTIFSIVVAGAVVAGGYALYRNADKIGGAFSRGVETNLTNPLGNYLDSLFKGSQSTATNPGSGVQNQAAPNVNPAAILNPIPTATAQTPTADTAITPSYANDLTTKYLPMAQASAKKALEILKPSSNLKPVSTSGTDKFISITNEIASKSPTPELSQAYAITDYIRQSVSNPGDPRQDATKNKFYQLFRLNNTPYDTRVLPLSQAAVLSYAKSGIIGREVYI